MDNFLEDEYNLNDYRVEILVDSIDHREPTSHHQKLACVDNRTGDTLVFQEMNFF